MAWRRGDPDAERRALDDRTLTWVQMRHVGVSPSEIARKYGVGISTVTMTTNRVRAAAIQAEPSAAADFW